MHGIVGAIARRGVDVHRTLNENEVYHMPVWGILLLGSTFLFFFAYLGMIEYTFGRLVPSLIMIESPQAVVFEPLASEDPDAPLGDEKVEAELMVVKQAPITSNFVSALRHLRAKAGRSSRFRGVSVFFVNTLLVQYAAQTISLLNFIPPGSAPVFAAVALAQISMTWTHVVISDPSPKRWYRRIPSFKTWKKVAGPTAVLAIAGELAVVLPAYLALYYDIPGTTPDNISELSPSDIKMLLLKGISVVGLCLAVAVLLVVPANVTLTRVQASLLPDNEETIVPFDRSFGGKVVPEVVGGSGAVGVLDAWRTFSWNSRIRLLKAYFKVMAMQLALVSIMMVTMGLEIFMIMGDDLKKFIPKSGNEVIVD